MNTTRIHSTHSLAAVLAVVTFAWATVNAVDSSPVATNEAMSPESISTMHARIPAGNDTAEPAPTF